MTAMYAKVTSESATVPRTDNEPLLRPSEFPLCSVLVLDAMKHGNKRTSSYMSDAFTAMGHGIHKAIHKWAAVQESRQRLLGDWHCPKCDRKTLEFSTETECPECGTECEYIELEVEHKGVKGHLDCVLLDNDNGISIGDYKTSTDYGVSSKGASEGYRLANVYQLFSYAYLFFRTYGNRGSWKKRTASLLFVSRNNPHNFKEWSWPLDFAEKAGKTIVDEQVRSWRAAEKAAKKDDFDIAYDARKCDSAADYERTMEQALYDGCPLADRCVYASNGRKALKRYFVNQGRRK